MFHVPEKYRVKGSVPAEFKNHGRFLIPHSNMPKTFYFVQSSDGMGWEHVSVSLQKITSKGRMGIKRCPTWEEMCFIKKLFWDGEDCVLQYHPPETDYVSLHPYCLHLWRPTDQEVHRPPKILVGW